MRQSPVVSSRIQIGGRVMPPWVTAQNNSRRGFDQRPPPLPVSSPPDESDYEEIDHLPRYSNTGQKKPVKRTCGLCGSSNPVVSCEMCNEQIFCGSCNDMYHRHPKRANHSRKLLASVESRPPLPPKTFSPFLPPVPPPRRRQRLASASSSPQLCRRFIETPLPTTRLVTTQFNPFGSLRRLVGFGQRPLPPVPPPSPPPPTSKVGIPLTVLEMSRGSRGSLASLQNIKQTSHDSGYPEWDEEPRRFSTASSSHFGTLQRQTHHHQQQPPSQQQFRRPLPGPPLPPKPMFRSVFDLREEENREQRREMMPRNNNREMAMRPPSRKLETPPPRPPPSPLMTMRKEEELMERDDSDFSSADETTIQPNPTGPWSCSFCTFIAKSSQYSQYSNPRSSRVCTICAKTNTVYNEYNKMDKRRNSNEDFYGNSIVQQNKTPKALTTTGVGSSPPQRQRAFSEVVRKPSPGFAHSRGTSPPPQEISTQTYEVISKPKEEPQPPPMSPMFDEPDERKFEMSEKAQRYARRAEQQSRLKRSLSTHLTNSSDFESTGNLYRSLSRHSLASDTRSLPISGPPSREDSPPRRFTAAPSWDAFPSPSDFFASIEDLVARRRRDSMRSQENELGMLLKEAEEFGFGPEDVQVALRMCGDRNPIKWLQEDWIKMIETVQTLATKYGREKENNEIGTISTNEAKQTLRQHKGNVWAAVTECTEQRRKKFHELESRGNFVREDILTALTANHGNLEAAYVELSKAQLKPFLMRIWGPPNGRDNDDFPSFPQSDIERKPGKLEHSERELEIKESEAKVETLTEDSCDEIAEDCGTVEPESYVATLILNKEKVEFLSYAVDKKEDKKEVQQIPHVKKFSIKDKKPKRPNYLSLNVNRKKAPMHPKRELIKGEILSPKFNFKEEKFNLNQMVKMQEELNRNLNLEIQRHELQQSMKKKLEESNAQKNSNLQKDSNPQKPSNPQNAINPQKDSSALKNPYLQKDPNLQKDLLQKDPNLEKDSILKKNIQGRISLNGQIYPKTYDNKQEEEIDDYPDSEKEVGIVIKKEFTQTGMNSVSPNKSPNDVQSDDGISNNYEDIASQEEYYDESEDGDFFNESDFDYGDEEELGPSEEPNETAEVFLVKVPMGHLAKLITVQNNFGQAKLSDEVEVKEDELSSIQKEVMRLMKHGLSSEKAALAAHLLQMEFTEEDAISAAGECNSLSTALAYLQQHCQLCDGKFNAKEMISMIHCTHCCCRNCAREYFMVRIRDDPIVRLTCPFCKEPQNLSEDTDMGGEYLNNLDIMLKNLLDKNHHEMFQRKMRDWTLAKTPNFKWCSKCSSGFITEPLQTRLVCPDCSAVTCAICLEPWDKNHDHKDTNVVVCDSIGKSVVEYLNENCIECPRCHLKFALARGGCMHLTCTQCQYEFCSGCSALFSMGGKCKVTEYCPKLGLHAHHPRNCLYFLRDKESTSLAKLLEENSIPFLKETLDSNGCDGGKTRKCKVPIQKEVGDGLEDDFCGAEAPLGFAAVCKNHYIEYLGLLIWQNRLDPISILSNDDLETIIRRHSLKIFPGKPMGISELDHRTKLLKVINEEIPLK